MKILLIDDDLFVLKLLKMQFNNLGFTDLVSFNSGHEAYSCLNSNIGDFDLVMCDLQMPEMDGIEFMRHLSGINYTGGVILVSGEEQRILNTAEKLANARDLNVLGVLNKPVQPQLLAALLEKKQFRNSVNKNAVKIYGSDELQRAIKNDELLNYYQPQVVVSTGELVGVETLVRWQHPTDGLVFPDQFIATAEKYGLIDDLTRVVLSGALLQMGVWKDEGVYLNVSVNISMDNLSSLEFPELVEAAMKASGHKMDSLILEITESKLIANPLTVLEILSRLRLKGIGLSIDDFGTGHSSLAQLRDIPFTELKIDRSFVHGAYHDTSLQAIFEASLTMARQLGIKVVAEGVEDLDDWKYLQAKECDLAQGYFIAKPMAADKLKEWMLGWEKQCVSSLNS